MTYGKTRIIRKGISRSDYDIFGLSADAAAALHNVNAYVVNDGLTARHIEVTVWYEY